MLKLSGTTLGGIALGSPLLSFGNSPSNEGSSDPSQTNSYFNSLPAFTPPEPLAPDEMRITILGSSCIPRLSQECNSVYVEVGSGDQFVFDCGTGVAAKYNAMGLPICMPIIPVTSLTFIVSVRPKTVNLPYSSLVLRIRGLPTMTPITFSAGLITTGPGLFVKVSEICTDGIPKASASG